MEVFTIGHTNYSIDKFIDLIRKFNINCVVDVRSTPFSKYTPQFNENNLKLELNKRGIYYIKMGNEFGARRKNKKLYTVDGYLDFEKTRKDKDFLKGIERIKQGCNKGFNITLMCTERDPIDCHRTILVSKGLKDNGFNIKHILPNAEIQSQKKIEERLLNKYYPNRLQLSFDINKNLTEEEMIEEAYRIRNKEIGYPIGGEE
ncbi:hypothetical protein HMPREF1092_01721 [Clostridium thermobutyricum]|uniref:DUF488 domain-containing protein n=1 Tax=Clostridium thermobutyricum TaxID=29372 RepID=N9WHC1_9CLOT|nr:DUF488 domain-containing protein [Clostridium thermobutyricum]ENZ02486.1 hypothetical protein HMPREF1092_01721 [Clostridium thermobutyricum]